MDRSPVDTGLGPWPTKSPGWRQLPSGHDVSEQGGGHDRQTESDQGFDRDFCSIRFVAGFRYFICIRSDSDIAVREWRKATRQVSAKADDDRANQPPAATRNSV